MEINLEQGAHMLKAPVPRNEASFHLLQILQRRLTELPFVQGQIDTVVIRLSHSVFYIILTTNERIAAKKWGI